MQLNGFGFDIEADNLYLQFKKMWYIRFKSTDGAKTLSVYPFRESKEVVRQKIMNYIESFEDGVHVIGWNELGFDVWALWKFLDIKPTVGKKGKDYLGDKEVTFIDGYVLSMYLNPNSPKHSLEYVSGGEENADGKIDYRKSLIEAGAMKASDPKGHEFSFFHELMVPYCDRDVDSCIREVQKLWKQAQKMYRDKWLHPSFRQMQKDYFLYTAQAYSGVKFDKVKAEALVERVEKEMQEIKDKVDPKLPARPLKTSEMAFYKQPSKPYTKSGEPSATFLKWLEKHNATVEGKMITAYGFSVPIESNSILPVKPPMEIDDNMELKQYFLDSGWKPSDDFWNHKKGPDGKPERDSNGKFIRTTPKINHQGQLCPNLLKLDGEIPSLVVKYLSLRNRLGVVKGWLSDWRLEFDGRLSAEISGYAPTSRVKHRKITNVPKADIKVLLGNEMRDLFTVEKGYWYCGTDAAALENRTLASYTYKYDDGDFARRQIEGDPHCYSEDTEVLTLSGWKTFGTLQVGEKVAQYDKGVISFVEPSHIVWQDYEGDMIHIKTGKVDFLVTPDHRVLVENHKTRRPKVMLAKDIHNRNSNWRVPVNGFISNSGLDISNSSIQLAVALQADSYFNGESYRFEFVKERKINRLSEILKSLDVSYTITNGYTKKGNKTYRVNINKKSIPETMLLMEAKSWNENLYKLSAEQCEVFINEVQFWDGTTLENGDCILDTTSKDARDIVATIATLCGRKVTASFFPNRKGGLGSCDIFRVYISGKESTKGVALLGSKIQTVKYKGKIGCVSVPSTFIVVKRNNIIGISGNTFNAFSFFPKLHDSFDIGNEENKEDPLFKPWRNKAKTGAYLLAFGGGAPKLASSLGLSKKEGQVAYDNYWEQNKGLGLLKTNVEKYFDTTGQKKYIPAIDGRIVSVRGKNVLLSCLGQGCGAIAMSYAACFMDTWLGEMYIDELGRPYYLYDDLKVRRISMVHDEYSWEVEDGAQEVIREMSVKAIVKAGEVLKLALPLNGEGKISYEGTWKDVH